VIGAPETMSTQFDRASFTLRDEDGEPFEVVPGSLTQSVLLKTLPWRTFRWYRGQQHYSGSYWSATESEHVIYESRLELGRLLMADFDPDVQAIRAQPFMMRAIVGETVRRHVPDFLLITKSGPPLVVDVKPRERLDSPSVAMTFEWVGRLIESIGWRFEVATEQPVVELQNVRFLAGFRRPAGISPQCLNDFRDRDLDGIAFGEAVRTTSAPEPLARSALLHMLWTHELATDLSQVLSSTSVLRRGLAA